MSESSESYHIRSSATDAVIAGIRKARLAGIALGPANGWITFVLFATCKRYVEAGLGNDFASRLTKAVGAPVLEYRYAEDYGWGFLLVSPNGPSSKFWCNWSPTNSTELGKLDLSKLASTAPLEDLAPVLEQRDRQDARGQNPAYRFADILGLPAYRWLSPLLAEDDVSSYCNRGGFQIGKRPNRAYGRAKASLVVAIELPRRDLSAREAYNAVLPHLPYFDAGWVFHGLTGEGALSQNGRLSPKAGDWRFDFSRNENTEYAWARLSPNGGLHVTSGRRFLSVAKTVSECFELADDWMDSTDAAGIAVREPTLADCSEAISLFMTLERRQSTPVFWTVSGIVHMGTDRSSERKYDVAIDAKTGAIIVESMSRSRDAAWIPEKTRDRLNGGDWQKVGDDAD